VLVDVNGDGSAGSLDRRVLRNHYAESLPVVPTAALVADPTPGGAVLMAGSAAMRTFTTADGQTVTAEWSAARGTADGAEQRGLAPSAVPVPFAPLIAEESGYIHMITPWREPVGVFCALVSEESGYRHMLGLRPAREPVPVFFFGDVEGWTSASEESGYRHNQLTIDDLRLTIERPETAIGLRPGREGVPVFFSCDVEGAGAGGWIVIDDGVTANEAQLEPDLQPGLADPLGGDVL